jgi:hypothetical protein
MSEDSDYNINFLQPLKAVADYLVKEIPESKESKIIEITRAANSMFPLRSEKIDFFKLNDFRTLDALQSSEPVDFVYVRHTLETLESPQVVFEILSNLSQTGYIESTSPLVELSKNVERTITDTHRGMYLTRYILWTEKEDNSLHILPKYGVFDYFNVDPNFENNIKNVLLDSPVYWNNYYFWNPENPPKIVYHSFGNDFDWETYGAMIGRAIHHNMEYTNAFMEKVKPYSSEPQTQTQTESEGFDTSSKSSTSLKNESEVEVDGFQEPIKPSTQTQPQSLDNPFDLEHSTSLS